MQPIRVATGEHVQNRVIFKQLLQAEAIDVVQIDACRVGGVNENLAILLLAAKFGVPVCPHAGGVGLCEMVQHLAMFDFVAVSGTTDGRWIEYVDHLHEHFTDPVVVERRAVPGSDRPGGRRPAPRCLHRRVPVPGRPGLVARRSAMSADDFVGLRVLVTGGASGIGHAVAAAALHRGATVAVLDLDPSTAPAGARLEADVADDESVAAVEAAASTMGGLDVLVNNAGIGAQGTVEENDDEWRRVLDVNVLGMVRMARAALAHLRRSPTRPSSTPAPSRPPRACRSAPSTARPRAPCCR